MKGTKKQLTLASDDFSANYFKHQENKVKPEPHGKKCYNAMLERWMLITLQTFSILLHIS